MDSDWIILNCRKTSQSLFIDSLNCWTILHFSLKISSVYLRKHCSFNLVDSVSIGGHRIIYYGNGFFIYFICLIQKDVGLRKEDNFSFGIHFKCLKKIFFLFPASYWLAEGNFSIIKYHVYLFNRVYYFKLLHVFFRFKEAIIY